MGEEIRGNPKLSKKLINKTLSAKKKSAKSMRNILSSTHEGNSWQCIEGDDKAKILQELDEIVNNAMKKNTSFDNTKNNRKPKLLLNMRLLRSSIAFGINESKKYLEKSKCCGILLDASAPKLIISHLVVLASIKNIPLFYMKDLKSFLNLKFGFKSCAVCFKENHCENMVKLIDKMKMDVDVKKENNVGVINMETESTSCENSAEIKTFTYLYRKNLNERVFKPPLSRKAIIDNIESKRSSDFLALRLNSGHSKSVVNKRITNSSSFKPLIVKKIKANPNRNKIN